LLYFIHLFLEKQKREQCSLMHNFPTYYCQEKIKNVKKLNIFIEKKLAYKTSKKIVF